MAGKKDIVDLALKMVMGGSDDVAKQIANIRRSEPFPADYIEPGSIRYRYEHPDTSSFMEIVTRPKGARSASVIGLEVPEEYRGTGIGKALQERVLQDYPSLMGQVSSKAAAVNAYKAGRRPLANPNATLEDVFKMIDEDSSVNLATEKNIGGSIRQGYQTKGRVVGDIVDQALKLVMGAGEEAAPKAAIRAYHASPHDFDKFEWSPRTFGTGEGAQSYGAGLYFAESPLVSGRGGTYDQQFTRKLLELDKSGGDTRMNRLKIGDQPLTSYGVEYDPEFIEAVKSGNEFRYAQNRLDRWHELSGDEAYPYRDYALEKVQAWEKLLNDMHSGKSAYYPTKSRIYEVDINARPTQLLDWDAPIKEQSGEIQRAVGNLPVNRPLSNYSVIGEPVQIDPYPNAPPALKAKLVALDGGVPYTVSVRTPEGGIVKIKGATPEEALSNANEYAGKAVKDLMSRTGGDLVKSLERGDYSIPDRTAKLNATGSLYKEGIPGLRYLDAGSRSGNVADPTRNYVIWNDQLIDLKKKYEHGGRIAKGPGGWVDDVVKMAGKVISGQGDDAAKAGIRAYHGTPQPTENLIDLFHGTTPEAFDAITSSGNIFGSSRFSPRRDVAETFAYNVGGDDNTVVKVKAPASSLMIDLDLPNAKLLTPDQAAAYLDKPDWTILDFIENGYSVGVPDTSVLSIDRAAGGRTGFYGNNSISGALNVARGLNGGK